MIPKTILNRLAAVEERVGAKAPVGFTTYLIDAPVDLLDAGEWLRAQGLLLEGPSIFLKFVDPQNRHREPHLREIRRSPGTTSPGAPGVLPSPYFYQKQ